MNYDKFRFEAVVDWIDVSIETVASTNFDTVRRHGGFHFVEPIDPNAGGGTRNFICRIQDPINITNVRRILDNLAKAVPLTTLDDPKVAGIEISFDAYSKGASQNDLIEVAARFYKFLANPCSTNRRFPSLPDLKEDGPPPIPYGFPDLCRMIRNGRTIAIGSQKSGWWGKKDPVSQRIYFKTTDNGGKSTTADGKEVKPRARIEVTLQGSGLPFNTLSESSSFKFTSLTKWFRWRTERPDLTPLRKLLTGCKPQIGERIEPTEESREKKRIRYRKSGGTVLYDDSTCADLALNDKAKGALKRLTEKWRR